MVTTSFCLAKDTVNSPALCNKVTPKLKKIFNDLSGFYWIVILIS